MAKNKQRFMLDGGVMFVQALLTLLCIYQIFRLCEGQLFFSLDDPYITLSMADQIISGHYGVNANEFSAPNSSILYPFIAAVTESFELGPWGLALFNVLTSLTTTYFALDILHRTKVIDLENFPVLSWLIALLSIFLFSGIALPLTGMEHSLHVLLAVVVLRGLFQTADGKKPSLLTLGAIVLMPLVRYEGLPFSLGALAALSLLGFWRTAILTGGIVASALAVDVAFLLSVGLPPLPSSVLLKSSVASHALAHASPLHSMIGNLRTSIRSPTGRFILAMGAVILSVAYTRRRVAPRLSIVQGGVAFAILAHVLFGAYGWWFRYEVYIVAIAGLTAMHAMGSYAFEAPPIRVHAQGLALLIVAFPAVYFGRAAILTPAASRNDYEQQYQMGRFAKEYFRGPVGVNDLGLVSYRNENYVLDLYGLASEPVRKERMAGTLDPQKIAHLAAEHNVGLVMIYDSYFAGGIPNSWIQVAVLHTPKVVAAAGDVSFYITIPYYRDKVVAELEKFKTTLPPQDVLTITSN